jgi:hypothetical protein
VIKRTKSARPSLRLQHPSEYASWKAMGQRVKASGKVLHRQFQSFEQFIAIVGLKPDSQFTLDRIDRRRGYVPNNVRWASKSLQTRNRGNTVWLTYTGDRYPRHRGKTLSRAEWAEITNQNQNTMRGRSRSQWSDNEIIDGEREARPKSFSEMTFKELLDYQPWFPEIAEMSERFYQQSHRTDETRFEFLRRFIENKQFDVLWRRYRHVGYFMHDEDERDAAELHFGEDFEGVDGDWGRKPGSTQAEWKQLLNAYAAHKNKYAAVRTQHERWKKAMLELRIANTQAKIHARRQQRLRQRYK